MTATKRRPPVVILTRLIALFVLRARELGIDVSDLCRRYKLPTEYPQIVPVSIGIEAFEAFAMDVAARAGDPLFGFHSALETPRGTFGALEYIVRNAPTVRALGERLERYGHLINEKMVFRFDPRSGLVSERIPGAPRCLGKHGNEYSIAHLVKTGREILGPKLAITRIYFAHEPGGPDGELQAYFEGCKLTYGAGFNGVELPLRVLDAALDHADPVLLDLLEERAGDGGAHAADANETLAWVRRAIQENIAESVDADLLARRLGVSQRTLGRRLAAERISLREVIDDVRREMAMAALSDEELSLTEVAVRVGYSDARAFTRAFQRWTGVTPAAHRATQKRRG